MTVGTSDDKRPVPVTDDESPAPRTERLAKRLAATVVLVSIVALLFIVAYVHASTAGTQAEQASRQAREAASSAREIATCVNAILGTRAKPSAAANDEQAKWVAALADVLAAPPSKVNAIYLKFKVETQRYRAVLFANEATQHAHPLGLC